MEIGMKDIRKWFIFTEYGNNAKHLELDLSNEDVNFLEENNDQKIINKFLISKYNIQI